MLCLVFALTLPVAWLHGRFWCTALNRWLEAPGKHAAIRGAASKADGRDMRVALQAQPG